MDRKNALVPKVGSVAKVTVSGESVMLVLNQDDDIAAYYNVCPHRAHEMVSPNTRS